MDVATSADVAAAARARETRSRRAVWDETCEALACGDRVDREPASSRSSS